jgi:CheY-like chemotaxis protein
LNIPASAKPSVLIVDDEPGVVAVIASVLEGRANGIATTANGQSASEELTRRKFDILFSDDVLPGMSGLELIRLAKRYSPHLRCILMSACLPSSLDHQGVDHLLPKPISRESVLAALMGEGS